MAHKLPVIEVLVDGRRKVKALVDTGCAKSVVSSQLVDKCEGDVYVVAFDGSRVRCRGRRDLRLDVFGIEVLVDVVVADRILDEVEMVLGMDIINFLGGVSIVNGKVEFCGVCCIVDSKLSDKVVTVTDNDGSTMSKLIENRVKPEVLSDNDFEAVFDGDVWTVEWKWKNEPPVLQNKISDYTGQLDEGVRSRFEGEVDKWVEEGILIPWHKKVKFGVIPLMAVVQPTKDKVRPVLDFRELNQYISCHTGDEITDVCGETLREWRRMEAETIVDLKAAYLQIRVSESLWKYQLVNYKGKTYCLTRLGFGLSSAPRIMSKILKTVLSRTARINNATNSYIDDIIVNEEKVSAEELVQHLKSNGLIAKKPESLIGGSALGLKLCMNNQNDLIFSRGNDIPESVYAGISKRTLFSICGKLIGHYPIAGWLRVACSFMKRMASEGGWNDKVSDQVLIMMNDVLSRVKECDPVKGKWYVPLVSKGTVWCDASNIAMGVLLEINGCIVEDGAWLKKKDDFSHINVSELEALMKGLNMALKWNLKEVEIVTDSATVYGWVQTVLSEEKRVQTKGAAELLVKRRLGILRDLIEEFELHVSIKLVPTKKNKADNLTRVKKEWLEMEKRNVDVHVCAIGFPNLRTLHEMHHMGVDRSLFLARKVRPNVSRAAMKKVVQTCERCQSIDPAPTKHEVGHLSVVDNWRRLAVDITHHHQTPYLSIVDCGPSRFAIWKELKRETAEFVVEILNELSMERGPAREMLMDNGTVFHSEMMKKFLLRWGIKPVYRAAYRPSGNGIVERHHRTIKALAERGNISPIEAVYWYNITPRQGISPESVPHHMIYQYKWRDPSENVDDGDNEVGNSRFDVGDEVWVKPPNARCVTQWNRGVVTGVSSANNVDVDGMARHVLDVRRVVNEEELQSDEEDEVEEDEVNDSTDEREEIDCSGEITGLRRSERQRYRPRWMDNYEC